MPAEGYERTPQTWVQQDKVFALHTQPMNATTTGAAASEIGESTMPNIPTTSTAPRPTQSQFAVAPSETHSEVRHACKHCAFVTTYLNRYF